MEFKIPDSLKAQHAELEVELRKATREGGGLGDVANAVTTLMQLHFAKEEKYALPVLGLLPELAQGRVTAEMAAVLPLVDKMKLELNDMLNDHKAIVAALTDFANAARAGDKLRYVRVAEKLILHARA